MNQDKYSKVCTNTLTMVDMGTEQDVLSLPQIGGGVIFFKQQMPWYSGPQFKYCSLVICIFQRKIGKIIVPITGI